MLGTRRSGGTEGRGGPRYGIASAAGRVFGSRAGVVGVMVVVVVVGEDF
jgi:hypothetical protein